MSFSWKSLIAWRGALGLILALSSGTAQALSLTNGSLAVGVSDSNGAINSVVFGAADFYDPGTAISDWGLQVGTNTSSFRSNTAEGSTGIPVTVAASGDTIDVSGTYTVGGANLAFVRTYRLVAGLNALRVSTAFINQGSTLVVSYFDTFDPDQGYPSYYTANDVLTIGSIVVGEARASNGLTVVMGSADADVTVAAGGPFDIDSGSTLNDFFLSPMDANGTMDDEGVHVGFRFSLAAGESRSVTYLQAYGNSSTVARNAFEAAVCAPDAPDDDDDGTCNVADNCPAAANAGQADADDDGLGDACDSCDGFGDDSDGDGICDGSDNCVDVPNLAQTDTDDDGLGDACNDLFDGDGDELADDYDNCRDVSNPTQEDGDYDGIGDACDSCDGEGVDSDGDEVCDGADNCVDAPNLAQTDADDDGFGDACDTCVGPGTDDQDDDGYCEEADLCPDFPNGSAFSADFEDDISGWTATGPWHASTACGAELPGHSATTAFYFGSEGSCSYDGDDDVSGNLTSPVMDLVIPGLDQLMLTFNYRLRNTSTLIGFDSCFGDYAAVQISNDAGATFNTILDCDYGLIADGEWHQGFINVTGALNAHEIVFRFAFDSYGFGFGDPGGWLVDDVTISTCGCDSDSDADGHCDGRDNCPSIANSDQRDSDVDGPGDACDTCVGSGADDDADGFCSSADNCPDVANPSQTDSDHDGLGDNCDSCFGFGSDSDHDGFCEDVDNCPAVTNPSQTDIDADGLGDDCDSCFGFGFDSDHDGLCEDVDNCPEVANPAQEDSDDDDIGDACDSCIAIGSGSDSDGDGIDDACDPCFGIGSDSNGDGLCDSDVCDGLSQHSTLTTSFESGLDQWSATGLWHASSACDADLGGHLGTSVAYYGTDDTCDYDVGTSSGTLTSPVFDLSQGSIGQAFLTFRYLLQTEEFGCGYDRARVQISTDGGASFREIGGNCTGELTDGNSSWHEASIDISDAVGSPRVVVRFSLETIDSTVNDTEGWLIDDVSVIGCDCADDIDADGICDSRDQCVAGAGLGSISVRPKLELKRIGSDPDVGNDTLKLSGEFSLAGGFASLDPVTDGLRMIVVASGGEQKIDATMASAYFNGPGTRGWSRNRKGDQWLYRDDTPQVVAGITKVTLKDHSRIQPGQIKVVVQGKHGDYPIAATDAPLQVTLLLSGGQCAQTAFTAADCSANDSQDKLSCKHR